MFEKKINDKSYVVGEPTLRQNKAFIKFCSDQGINFTEVDNGVDLGEILLSGAKGDNLEKLLSIMIHEDGKIWAENDKVRGGVVFKFLLPIYPEYVKNT